MLDIEALENGEAPTNVKQSDEEKLSRRQNLEWQRVKKLYDSQRVYRNIMVALLEKEAEEILEIADVELCDLRTQLEQSGFATLKYSLLDSGAMQHADKPTVAEEANTYGIDVRVRGVNGDAAHDGDEEQGVVEVLLVLLVRVLVEDG